MTSGTLNETQLIILSYLITCLQGTSLDLALVCKHLNLWKNSGTPALFTPQRKERQAVVYIGYQSSPRVKFHMHLPSPLPASFIYSRTGRKSYSTFLVSR